ncbi:MAG: ATP-binding protein [Thermomicrobiales bacterium]
MSEPFLVGRERELAFLQQVATRQRPGPAQLILCYGRRRVGKTSLLRYWASASGLPTRYWTVEKEPAALQRRKLAALILGVPIAQAPTVSTWAEVWELAIRVFGDGRHLLVIDELPYASEADPAFLSALQHAWDVLFQHRAHVLVLCGSHERVMAALQAGQSPLFGRFTGQWHLEPLPFTSLPAFLPTWSDDDRLAAYAIVGGVPAYLRWLNPDIDLWGNLRSVILSPGSMFLTEPAFLLQDEVREPQAHLAILKAIGTGARTIEEISAATLLGKTHLSAYLARLQDLRLVERRLPITVPPAARRTSRRGRYHLSDPYFRFYFRFLAPAHETVVPMPEIVYEQIRRELSSYVGSTAFEELARRWVLARGMAGQLPLRPEEAGSHWGPGVQADVVAPNWGTKTILIGECKWTTAPVDVSVVRALIEQKLPQVLAALPSGGHGWATTPAIFTRAGATSGARALLLLHGGILVDLADFAGTDL